MMGGDWRIEIEAGPRMTSWAYRVYHIDGDEAIAYSDWMTDEEAVLDVPAWHDRAVVVVTCLETPYVNQFMLYADSGGHYALDATWSPTPVSGGSVPLSR
jgi:hypothetical protein